MTDAEWRKHYDELEWVYQRDVRLYKLYAIFWAAMTGILVAGIVWSRS